MGARASQYDIWREKATGDLYSGPRETLRIENELQPLNIRVFNGETYEVAPGHPIPGAQTPEPEEFEDPFFG